jgi:hypothetical protein
MKTRRRAGPLNHHAIEQERLEAEKLLYTTALSLSDIARLKRRSTTFIFNVNVERGVRIYTSRSQWRINPDYEPCDSRWRLYVEC